MKRVQTSIGWLPGLGGLVLLMLAGGCCSTPESVKQLSAVSIENNTILAEQHRQSLEGFTKFTTQAEEQANQLAEEIKKRNEQIRQLAYFALEKRIAAEEAALLARFDSAIWKLLATEFDEALDSYYWPPINRWTEKEHAKQKELKERAEKNPENALAARAYDEQRILVQYVLRRALEEEINLRTELAKRSAKEREEVKELIRARFQGLRDRFDLRVSEFSLSSIMTPPARAGDPTKETAASYNDVRTAIAGYGTAVEQQHSVQQQSLQAIDEYLNRPSVWVLVLGGMKQGIGDVVNLDLPELAPLRELLGPDLEALLSRGEEFIRDTVGQLVNEVDKRAASLSTKMTETTTKTTSEILSSERPPG